MATDINKKPDQNVINLSSPNPVANKGTTYRVTWGLTAHARDANNPARTTVVDVWWDVHLRSSSDRTKTRKLRAKQSYTGLSASMSAELNVSAFASAEPRASWSSADFYPQGDWLIERVVVYAHARNPKGEQPWLPSSRTLEPPRKPTVTDLAQGEGTGVVSFRATRAAGNAPNHARDVYATIAAYDSRVGGGKSPVAGSERSRESGTDVTLSYDVADFASMDYSDWVRVDAAAWDRGVSGNSDEVKKSLYVSCPAKPTVTGVRATSADSTGKVAVLLKTNATAQHPTTGMRLECARDVDWESASDVVGGYWEDAGVEDNGSCTALSVAVAEVAPAAGKTSWVRVKAWNQHESVFYRYSEPVRLSMLENPAPAADDPVAIVSTAPGADGASLDVTLAWDPDGTDDSDATELAWATDPLAWRSNQGPDSYAFSWDDGPLEVGGSSYLHSARVHVAGLGEGTTYHLRARRTMEGGAGAVNGPWYPEGTVTCATAKAPSSVALSAPATAPRGSSIALSWTFDSFSPQTSWEVVDGQGHVVARGDDAVGSCVLDASRVEALAAGAGSIMLSVRVTTGGEAVESEAATVAIADPPHLSVEASDVSAQPLSVSLACDVPARVAIVATSQGCVGDSPAGRSEQLAGDAVWSWSGAPAWAEDGVGGYEAVLTAPSALDLRDGAAYTVEATATDPVTGLTSEVTTATFLVAWLRVAPEPEGIVVSPSDSTDEDGIRTISAEISLPASQSLANGDSYDVWRVTPDGAYPLAYGVSPDSVVADLWAPYGGSPAYRVAVRTADGSVAWRDFGYELRANMLRIDFGESYVELPFNLAVSDGWSKDFEARRKLDGSVDGYWNEGSLRTAGLTTKVVKVRDAAQVALLRSLARHAGSCMVRTPDGCCYEADVEVGEVSVSHDSALVGVTLRATEVAPTGAYEASVGDWGDEGADAEPEDAGEVV